MQTAYHNIWIEWARDAALDNQGWRPQRSERLPQFLLLLGCSPLLVFGTRLRLQDADDELLLGSQRRIHVGRLLR